MTQNGEVQQYQVEKLKIEIHPTREAAAAAAAESAASSLTQLARNNAEFAVIFATGASQIDTLQALTQIPGLPWGHIRGFHMDEYVGLSRDHPASFRRYLRENLTQKVQLKEFFEIDGTASDPEQACKDYAALLRAANPQLCLLGIGENGHLAFNDPDVADFNDPLDVKVVQLDSICRQQQAAEGWFSSFEEVPEQRDDGHDSSAVSGAEADCFRSRSAKSGHCSPHAGGSDLDGLPGNPAPHSSRCDGIP